MQTQVMSTISKVGRWLIGLALVAMFIAPSATAFAPPVAHAPAGQTLADLPAAAQAAISAAIGQDLDDYHLQAQGDGYQASNPTHDLALSFDGASMHVRRGQATWGMALTSYSYGDRLQALPPADLVANGNRLEYRRPAGLVEWYVNGPLGLEHGFDLAAPPTAGQANDGPLTLALAVEAPGVLSGDGRGLTLAGDLTYSGLTAWDASGRSLPAWLELDGGRLLVRVDDVSAFYPLRIDPWLLSGKLSASDKAAFDGLGTSVAISGDVIVVGVPGADPGGVSRAGAAYVFVKPAGGWTDMSQMAKLYASDKAAEDNLGYSVSISGDVVVAGALIADTGGSRAGAVYVFVKPALGWANNSETAKLYASDKATGDWLGYSVSISGDVIVAGAPYADTGGQTDAGAAYVFVKPALGWVNATQTGKLYASDKTTGDRLGWSVAISGDVIVAGAPDAQPDAMDDAGAAYVFVKPAGGWADMSQMAKLYASDKAADDNLGYSVSISGDVIVAGAPFADTGGLIDAGAVYVFVKPAFGWANNSETAKLYATDKAAGDWLGAYSVSINGDVIVAGAPGKNVDREINAGAAYVFVKPESGWSDRSETAKIIDPNKSGNDSLGYSVAVSGNVIVAGVPAKKMDGIIMAGAAFVYVSTGDIYHTSDIYLPLVIKP